MCAAPIYLPSAMPSPAVRATEARIVASEGRLQVRGFQYARFSDADVARRREAEAQVREAARAAQLAQTCVWCSQPIADNVPANVLGGRRMHGGECRLEYDRLVYGSAACDAERDA